MDGDRRYGIGPSREPEVWPPKNPQQHWPSPRQSYEPAVNPADFLVSKADQSNGQQTVSNIAQASDTPPHTTQSAAAFPSPSQPPLQQPQAVPAVNNAPSGQKQPDITPNNQPPKFPAQDAEEAAKKRRKMYSIVGLVAGLIILIIGVIIFFQWLQPSTSTQTSVLDGVVANNVTTTSYKETSVTTDQNGEEIASQVRTVNFPEPDTLQLHITGIRTPGTNDTFEIMVNGKDYFIKPTISIQTLSTASPDQKLIYEMVHNKWVQVIQNGQPLTSPPIRLLKLHKVVDEQRLLQPTPFVIGSFSGEQQQKLIDLASQKNVYTPASSNPNTDIIDNIEAWKFDVSIDIAKLQELNRLASSMLGSEKPEDLAPHIEDIPQNITLWASRADSQLLQYSYTIDAQTTTATFSNINESVVLPSVDSPIIPENANAQVSDGEHKDKMTAIQQTLVERRQQGIAFPPDGATFTDFIEQQLPSDQHQGITLEFATGTPPQYVVYYHPQSSCSEDTRSVINNTDASTFTLFTTLATAGPYCIDNS